MKLDSIPPSGGITGDNASERLEAKPGNMRLPIDSLDSENEIVLAAMLTQTLQSTAKFQDRFLRSMNANSQYLVRQSKAQGAEDHTTLTQAGKFVKSVDIKPLFNEKDASEVANENQRLSDVNSDLV